MFALRVDLPPELVPLRKQLVDTKKVIQNENKKALASITYKSYKPVLIVKYKGKVQEYDASKMKIKDLQPGDPINRS